jgi:hypothetical protein
MNVDEDLRVHGSMLEIVSVWDSTCAFVSMQVPVFETRN